MAKISVKNLSQAIYESLQDKEGLSFEQTSINVISLMKEKHMLAKSEQILETLQKIIDEKNKIIRAKISSKSKIPDKNLKEIEEFIKKKYKVDEVIIDQIENVKLLGGIKIEILDMTLKNKLYQLQNYLITT
jgi:F0F1-type ATP synthase delta subunit